LGQGTRRDPEDASAPEYRFQIHKLRAQKLSDTAEAMYLYGRQVDAVWVLRHLWALTRAHPTSSAPATFLLALCLPRGIARETGRLTRLLRRVASRGRVESRLLR
jgi:hypothetical protein